MSKYIYKVCCKLHTQGGEHYALRDNDQSKWGHAELEDKEYVIRKEVHNKKIKVDNETANEVLTRLIKEYGSCDKSEDNIYSGDVIICRNAILNDKKYTFEGTLYEFMNKIQGDVGCKTLIDVNPQMTEKGFFKTGGCACEGEERYDDGGEVYQVHHLRGYKYPKEPVACQVKKFDEGGQITTEQAIKSFADAIEEMGMNINDSTQLNAAIKTLPKETFNLLSRMDKNTVFRAIREELDIRFKKGQKETKPELSGQKSTGQKMSNAETLNEFIQHPDLDAAIYIEKIDPKRDKIEYEHGWKYKGKISYPESLGEQGNYETGFVYKSYPSGEEQEKDIRDTLEQERKNIIEGGKKAFGLEEIYSGRDENILKAINKILDKKSPKESSETKSILTQKTDLKGDEKQDFQRTLEEYTKKMRRGRKEYLDANPEKAKEWHKQQIQNALDKGWYQEDILKGRMTAHDAKIIIESAGLKVPNDIETKAEPQNLPPTPWLIKEKLNLFTDLITKKDNIKEKAGVAIFYKDKILLTHPTGAGWHGTYSIPKGLMMQGETSIEAAGRELREETSIRLPERVVKQFSESQADIIMKYREGDESEQKQDYKNLE